MSEQEQDRKQKYHRVRSDFDDLKTEDKVVFLLEATVSTVARGIDELGRAVSDELGKAFDRRARKKEGDAEASAERDSSEDATSHGDGAPHDDSSGEERPENDPTP